MYDVGKRGKPSKGGRELIVWQNREWREGMNE